MNRDDIIELLQIVASYDNRDIDEYMEAAWFESARAANWTYPPAVQAVRRHFATSTAWLMPGHITQDIRARRPWPAPIREVLALPVAPPASVETRRRLVAGWRDL